MRPHTNPELIEQVIRVLVETTPLREAIADAIRTVEDAWGGQGDDFLERGYDESGVGALSDVAHQLADLFRAAADPVGHDPVRDG